MHVLGWLAASLAGVSLAIAPVGAQGVVRGRVSITERPGAEQHDVGNAVVYLEATSGGAVQGAAPAGATMAMRQRAFVPHVRVVAAGGTVAFPNEDPFSHNVFSNSALARFDLGLYRENASRDASFRRPGVHPIYCNIHARMVGFVLAVTTPYYAQPDADGRFRIPDVPEGRYLLHVWHERARLITRSIVVSADGVDDLHIVLDATEYRPTPHLNKFGLPYSATRRDRY